eukprot:CAMPEP_0119470678 /NCGR_PEP_ID=MMETSP1344-20130328/3476_1 /TAXON_ID=236787 /ORGANISM="Florenciella parvula, Strain CCMP2471" /LENGTH=158 /DNA_ID=CAMNT_0007503381 /DNA_START=175 /DNA_END=647 /DNA_ORIENTATION=-
MTLCRTFRLKICMASDRGKTAAEIFRRNPDLAPSLKTVEVIIAYYRLTGKYSPLRFPRRRRGSVGPRHLAWLLAELRKDPTLYLDEMREMLRSQFGCRYPLCTLCRTLIRNKQTRKVLSHISSRRSAFDRATFRATVRDIPAEWLVFLDETRKAARSL